MSLCYYVIMLSPLGARGESGKEYDYRVFEHEYFELENTIKIQLLIEYKTQVD